MNQTPRNRDNHLMLERLSKIHAKIKSGCYPNSKQLAYDFEISISTISRDIDFLKTRFDAPIAYDPQKRGYYYSSDYEMPLSMISAKDVAALSSAKALLAHYAGTPLYDDVALIIDFLTDSQTGGNAEFLHRIAVPPSPRLVVDAEVWNLLITAMQRNAVIEFDYNGRWHTETQHRRVHPYQLLFDDGVCFVFGYAEEREAERLFALPRIKNLCITKDSFALPADFDFATRCGGGKFGSFLADGEENYAVAFYGDAREYVKDCIWADDQVIIEHDVAEGDGWTEIRFTSAQSLKVREWVLAQGANARPLAPQWFVEDWQAVVRAMAKAAGVV